MRRSIIALLLLLAITSSAIALAATPAAILPWAAAMTAPVTTAPTATAAATTAPAASAAPGQAAPSLTAPPHATPSPLPGLQTPALPIPAPEAQGFRVRLHPDGALYAGDQVSFEVIAPPDAPPQELTARAELPGGEHAASVEARFGAHGIGARQQADLLWAWDTTTLPAGEYPIRFEILPGGPIWTETVTLLPAEERPASEAGARWAQVTSRCCRISYITGTAAERDLDELAAAIDRQAQDAAERLGTQLAEPVEIVLLPRVLGHGGFAGREIAVSYLDRDYIGGEKARIFHHEIIHILDSRLGGELRPSMLVEGFAVYLSDGHFKEERLPPRAAALLPPQEGCTAWSAGMAAGADVNGCGLDRFIPLARLIDNFYFEQHEIGYLESGALIAYMVERWGWPAFSDFYRDIHPVKADPANSGPATAAPAGPSAAVEVALQKHFGLDLPTLERDFRAALAAQPVSPQEVEDLRLSLLHFDTARRYQAALDPSAHFLTAWLLDVTEMKKRGITADYLRRPQQPENLALETMLTAAAQDLLAGEYGRVERLLAAANRVLDAYLQAGLQAFSGDPLAADYLALVELARAEGFEPQRISITNQTAQMWVTASGPELMQFDLIRQAGRWVLIADVFAYGVQLHKMPLRASNGGWQYRFR